MEARRALAQIANNAASAHAEAATLLATSRDVAFRAGAIPVFLPLARARSLGFDLHAGRVVPAGQRDRLEQVCAYVLQAPMAQEWLTVTADGQILLRFRQPWCDGTTHLVFDPVEFLGRLAVLIPRPRINLILYHGLLAPRAAWRAAVVPGRAARRVARRTRRWPTPRPLMQRRRRGAGRGVRCGPR